MLCAWLLLRRRRRCKGANPIWDNVIPLLDLPGRQVNGPWVYPCWTFLASGQWPLGFTESTRRSWRLRLFICVKEELTRRRNKWSRTSTSHRRRRLDMWGWREWRKVTEEEMEIQLMCASLDFVQFDGLWTVQLMCASLDVQVDGLWVCSESQWGGAEDYQNMQLEERESPKLGATHVCFPGLCSGRWPMSFPYFQWGEVEVNQERRSWQ